MNSDDVSVQTSNVTVVLTNDQTATLDEIAGNIRRHTGKAINRSAIIRGLLDGVLPYNRYWLSCRSAAELPQ